MKFYSVSLLVLTILLGTNSPASAQEFRIEFGTIINVVNSIINPPHRAAQQQADAEIAKERVRQAAGIEKVRTELQATKNADRVTPVIGKWGVDRTSCAPGTVVVNGISNDTVCLKPTARMAAGYYTYDAKQQLLVRTSSDRSAADPARHSQREAAPRMQREAGF